MRFVSDLHLHSKYSRAVSPSMNLSVMAQYAWQKGIDILTASDFTHPVWFKEISAQLIEKEEGLYTLKDEGGKSPLFLLSTEISSIYKQGDKVRRVHNLVFVPELATAEKLSKALVAKGCNLNADGRPIIGLTSEALLELILTIDERSFLIPCHIWTPHFGVYGSASGFDSLKQAYGSLSSHIYGIETGLSSDPDMNWQITELLNKSILSFSDAHSPAKMGREATVFELIKPSFLNIKDAIMHTVANNGKKDVNTIAYTVEFYPEEGKYHFSGHRKCKVVFGPEQIRSQGNTCPVCRSRLTEGVLFRVEQLTDPKLVNRATKRVDGKGVLWYEDSRHLQPPYVKLVPLLEIIAKATGSTVASQKTQQLFALVCQKLGSEMAVLLDTDLSAITSVAGEQVAMAVKMDRAGEITVEPGYDGEYGKVTIPREGLLSKNQSQLALNL